MRKVKIRIIILGHIPFAIDINKIIKWKSNLFEIINQIQTYTIVTHADGQNWDFLDSNIENLLPSRVDEDIVFAVTNVPLQNNYYARRFTDNRVCMTYNEMSEILKFDNIPLENLLLRILYSFAFVYKRYGNRIPPMNENVTFTHDETRGCIFDMNGIKTDVIYSLNRPQLCDFCINQMKEQKVHRIDKELICKVQNELNKINKGVYHQLKDLVKEEPILAIILSSFVGIVLGIISSLIATYIWVKLIT